ncbi:hypothetical protein Slin15195_G113920 [Septoria linicola]|uniref:Uncharacterized protein n=1 Tax=Septoria linicola TaxID=215465 RepID=A0A9Q9B347_9PEZI|nr:hypothetical protein Slin14017_G112260 [Septoria linicola]USW58073.1 hypothetical protein Slin15195_G113920 [Septoria linicola]
MQFIAITLFAATALAAATPQWRNNNNWGRPDGNQEGAYMSQCSCNRNDGPWPQQDDNLGEAACWDLHSQYQNLYWQDGRGCIDRDGRGIEPQGMERACQRQAGGYAAVSSNCL